jgi:hypothetical protein
MQGQEGRDEVLGRRRAADGKRRVIRVANINPDPHRYGYVFVPLNRVTALFESGADAKAAVGEVQALGIDARAIDVFVGEDGAAALDLEGLEHGSVIRTLRNLESLMVQIAEQTTDDAEQTLKSGGIAVAILMDERESLKDEVAAVLRRHEARAIRYWGRWTIEALDH